VCSCVAVLVCPPLCVAAACRCALHRRHGHVYGGCFVVVIVSWLCFAAAAVAGVWESSPHGIPEFAKRLLNFRALLHAAAFGGSVPAIAIVVFFLCLVAWLFTGCLLACLCAL
jgi:hypothetical protein